MEPQEILERLRTISHVTVPMWLSGGVAVDFLVGYWTRSHGDIDIVAFHHHRENLAVQLRDAGVVLVQDGYWTTKWSVRDQPSTDIEFVFVEQSSDATGTLVIPENDPSGGTPGRYPFVPGYLDPEHWRELDGVRFRTCSAEGEWFNRRAAEQGGVVQGRVPEPKILRDRRQLERLVPSERRAELWRGGHPTS